MRPVRLFQHTSVLLQKFYPLRNTITRIISFLRWLIFGTLPGGVRVFISSDGSVCIIIPNQLIVLYSQAFLNCTPDEVGTVTNEQHTSFTNSDDQLVVEER